MNRALVTSESPKTRSSHLYSGGRPLPALSVTPVQSASVPPSAHPPSPSTLDGKDPGMGEAALCPLGFLVNSAQGVRGSTGWQVWRGMGRPLCAPWALPYPTRVFSREFSAFCPIPPLPGAAMGLPASSISALATLNPPAGLPLPGPPALAPAQATQ